MGDKNVQMPDGSVVAFPDSMSDDQIASVLKAQHPAAQTPPQQGFLGSLADSSGLSMIGHVIAHPLDTAATVLDAAKRVVAPNQPANMSDNPNPIISGIGTAIDNTKAKFKQGVADYKATGLSLQTRRDFGNAIPILGPALETAEQQSDAGNNTGAMGTMTGLGLAALAPKAIKEAPAAMVNAASKATSAAGGVIPAAARLIAGDALDTPIRGDSVTPRDLYNTAKSMGVNLDTAQATGSALTGAAKRVTEHSWTGASNFAKNSISNAEALQTQAAKILDDAHPDPVSQQAFGEGLQDLLTSHRDVLDEQAALPQAAQAIADGITPDSVSREQFGGGVQMALRKHADLLNAKAGELFDDLDDRVGDNMPDTSAIRKQAYGIVQANSGFLSKYPQFLKGAQGQAYSLVQHLADTGDESTRVDSWSDLHKLRSNLMNMYRSPDIVGSPAEGWLKQLAGKVDESMTGAASGLPPEDQATFRQANQLYSDLKQTYDNPQSKLYHIVRAPDALSAANSLANVTPTVARQIGRAATDLGTPEMVQHLQRQTVERLLDPPGNGSPDLEGFPSRFARAQKEQLGGVLASQQISALQDLSDKLSSDGPYDNPRSDVHKIINAKDGVQATTAALNAGPEGLAQIQKAASTLGDTDTIPQLQRQTISRILTPAGNDIPDFQTLSARLSRIPKEQLNSVLTPAQSQQLTDLARVSRAVYGDSNPSGSGKVLQAHGEVKGILGGLGIGAEELINGRPVTAAIAAGAPVVYGGAQKVVAKALTNPAFTEAVMKATKGPEGWALRGQAKVMDFMSRDASSGLTSADLDKLRSTPAGKKVLIDASGRSSGSAAMKRLVAQLASMKAQL